MRWSAVLLLWLFVQGVAAHDLDDLERRIQALEALIHTHEPVPPPEPEPCVGIIDSEGNCIPPEPDPEPCIDSVTGGPCTEPEPPTGVLGFRGWTSVADVQDAQSPTITGKKVDPNHAKCLLMGGADFCGSPWPPKIGRDGSSNFDGAGNLIGGELSSEAARLGVFLPLRIDEYTCEVKDRLYEAYKVDLGRAWAEGYESGTVVQTSMWAACYDASMNAARYHEWGTLKGTPGNLRGFRLEGDPVTVGEAFVIQFEVAFRGDYWRLPRGSSTAKLFRVSRYKDTTCNDDRAHDVRIESLPDVVRIKRMSYCGGGYAPGAAIFELSPDKAGVWYRITFEFTRPGGSVKVEDIATGLVVFEHVSADLARVNDGLKSLWKIGHSSSRLSCFNSPEDLSYCTDSPAMWLRNLSSWSR